VGKITVSFDLRISPRENLFVFEFEPKEIDLEISKR